MSFAHECIGEPSLGFGAMIKLRERKCGPLWLRKEAR
jgi:hypothetical protein